MSYVAAREMHDRFKARDAKVAALVESGGIVKSGNEYLVPSLNSDAVYRVSWGENGAQCTCPHFLVRGAVCKHISAANEVASREAGAR